MARCLPADDIDPIMYPSGGRDMVGNDEIFDKKSDKNHNNLETVPAHHSPRHLAERFD